MNHAIALLQLELALLCEAQEASTSSKEIQELQENIEETSASIDLLMQHNR